MQKRGRGEIVDGRDGKLWGKEKDAALFAGARSSGFHPD